nr:unnamed protein product [Naegleria fowleri]
MSNAMIVALLGSPSKRRNSIVTTAFDQNCARELVSRSNSIVVAGAAATIGSQRRQELPRPSLSGRTNASSILHLNHYHVPPPTYALPEETLLNLLSLEVSPIDLQERFKQYFVENERVIQHYKRQFEEYKEKLNHANEENAFLSNQIHQLTCELNALTEELHDEKEKLNQSTIDLESVQQEVLNLRQENESLHKQITRQNECIQNSSSHLIQIQEDFRKTKQENETRIEELTHEIDILKHECCQQKNLIEQVDTKCDSVPNQFLSPNCTIDSSTLTPNIDNHHQSLDLLQALKELQLERKKLRLEFERNINLMKESIIKDMVSKRMKLCFDKSGLSRIASSRFRKEKVTPSFSDHVHSSTLQE